MTPASFVHIKSVIRFLGAKFLGGFAILLLFSSYVQAQFKVDEVAKAEYIKIIKSERKLFTYSKSKLLKTYKIALGKNAVGQKLSEGDGKTPEGIYEIVAKNPKSAYHLSLKISYPNAEQIEEAKKSSSNPGGDIMIHGIRNGFGFVGKYHALIDWTKGCIAVTDKEIEEIYNSTSVGTKVEILP